MSKQRRYGSGISEEFLRDITELAKNIKGLADDAANEDRMTRKQRERMNEIIAAEFTGKEDAK